jgi:ubiquinone/menaquinone biosynthesis C-methylase UbiE
VNVYEKYLLPWLIHVSMRSKMAMAERRRFIPLASGTVLEVGVGSGLNLPFYGPAVQRLYALDPSRELWKMARKRVRKVAFPVEFLAASAERIPLEDVSADTAVSTWTLCTIPDPLQALSEVRRVLKPKGRLIFVEHGRAPDPSVVAWQNRLTPVWKRFAGGCHLNRQIDALIADAGFDITQIERGYRRGPTLMTYLYKGLAQRPA